MVMSQRHTKSDEILQRRWLREGEPSSGSVVRISNDPASASGRHLPVAGLPARKGCDQPEAPRLDTDEAVGHPPWSEPAGCSAISGMDVQPDRNPHYRSTAGQNLPDSGL